MKKFTDYINEQETRVVRTPVSEFKKLDSRSQKVRTADGKESTVGAEWDKGIEAGKRLRAMRTKTVKEDVEVEDLTEATNEAKKHIEAMKFHKKKNKEHLANAHVGMESDKFHSQIEKATHHRDLYFTHRDAHNRLKGK